MDRVKECEELKPSMLAVLEREAEPSERRLVDAHLDRCEECRRWLDAERRLTFLLSPRRRTIPWRWPLGVAASLLVMVAAFVLLTPQTRAYGSIAPTRFAPSLTLDNGNVRQLTSHNHLRVPTHEEDVIDVAAVGTLVVVGPAVIELDLAPEGWKLVLLRGFVRAELVAGAQLRVTSEFGVRTLLAGAHLIRLDPAWFGPDAAADGASDAADDPTPAALLDEGHVAFFQRQDMAAAERAYRAAFEHKDATAEQKNRALFYLTAAVARQERYDDAIALGDEWLERNPDDDSFEYVLLFKGIYLARLGRDEEARAAWTLILKRDPDSEMATQARAQLAAAGAGTSSAEKPTVDVYAPDRLLPAERRGSGGLLVVALGAAPDPLERKRFTAVAKTIAAERKSPLLELATFDLARLESELRARLPESVLFVVPPTLLDVALHREVVLLSARLDEDVFADFSFGWFTARDGKALEALWRGTEETRRQGLSSRRWVTTFVTSGMKSTQYPGEQLALAHAGGFEEEAYAFAEIQSDPDCLAFVEKTLPRLEKAGVVTITGNGDPQGVWLFDGDRNLDPKLHWPYDPARIGEDKDGVMPRIRAARFAALKLDRPIFWSGTCHSAATHRVFVEGDIVSTFGRTGDGPGGNPTTPTIYVMPADESMALGLLSAGAVALLAPIGANHGYAVDLEAEYALEHGASLGETIESTWNDVFLQARGAPKLVIPRAGVAQDAFAEPVMQGGGVNRALLGDPTLRPFEKVAHPSEQVRITKTGAGSFDVVVDWMRGTHIKSWNLYAADMQPGRKRVLAIVDVTELIPADVALRISATCAATGNGGESLPQVKLTHAEPEVDHGRRLLHLQAEGPEASLADRDVHALFHVTWRR